MEKLNSCESSMKKQKSKFGNTGGRMAPKQILDS